MKGWRGFLVGIGIMCVGLKLLNRQHIMEARAARSVTTCRPVAAHVLSDSLQRSITETVQSYDHIRMEPLFLETVIRDQFPCIKSICIQKRLGKVTMMYDVYAPLIQCNEQWLFLENGILVPKEFYTKSSYTITPSFVSTDSSVKNMCLEKAAFINRVGIEFFKHFSVLWKDQSCIELREQECPEIVYIIDAAKSDYVDLFKKINFVKKEVMNLNEGKKRLSCYKADFRFVGQIVLSVQKGGRV